MSITDIRQAVLTGDADAAADLARAELEAGTAPAVIMNDALISAMDEAGARMATGELFIPEVLVASEAMRAAMDVITPHLEVEATGGRGTVVIGAVEGDVHDIGKSLVALMLDGAGFTVHDLGVDVPTPAFVTAAKEHDACARRASEPSRSSAARRSRRRSPTRSGPPGTHPTPAARCAWCATCCSRSTAHEVTRGRRALARRPLASSCAPPVSRARAARSRARPPRPSAARARCRTPRCASWGR